MPPTPIPDNYGLAVAKYQLTASGEVMVTTFGFHNTGVDDAITNASLISGIWTDNFTIATTLDQYTYLGMYILEKIGGVLQSAQTSDDLAGTVNAEPVSPAVSACITKQTSFTGVKYRGRMYLPPAMLAEINVNAGGTIDTATFDQLTANATGLLSDLDAAGVPMYLLHSDASTPTPVNDLLVRSRVRTQRRRQHLV